MSSFAYICLTCAFTVLRETTSCSWIYVRSRPRANTCHHNHRGNHASNNPAALHFALRRGFAGQRIALRVDRRLSFSCFLHFSRILLFSHLFLLFLSERLFGTVAPRIVNSIMRFYARARLVPSWSNLAFPQFSALMEGGINVDGGILEKGCFRRFFLDRRPSRLIFSLLTSGSKPIEA